MKMDLEEALAEQCEAFYAAFEVDDDAAAKRALDEAERLAPDHPEIQFCRGQMVWAREGAASAETIFKKIVEKLPEHSDAHHALARIYEETGDAEARKKHDLEVLRLDEEEEAEAGFTEEDVQQLTEIAEGVLEDLPEALQERIGGELELSVAPRPTREMVEEGFDPRAFGIFEGPTEGGNGTPPKLTGITLFYANLLTELSDTDDFEEEVRWALLEELGGFFGLSVDDLDKDDLD